MKTIFSVSLILLSGLVFCQNYRVLFLGNSYTSVNDLPGTIYNLAASGGDTITYDSNTPGGYTFMQHSTDVNSLNKIKSSAWDFVVLQAQSQEPSFPYAQFMTDTYPYAIALDSLIHANDSCSQTIFYMTWGRKLGDSQWDSINTFEKMNNRLRSAYLRMGENNQAVVAPVGAAWRSSWEENQSINLWSSDNSHPSISGTYLTACVFYATLWHKSPIGLPFTAGLNQSEALFLQQIAEKIVIDSIQNWGIGVYDPWIAFEYTNTGSGVQFENLSQGSNSYDWNFGDGTFSQESNPFHYYITDGSYQVTLIGSDSCQIRSATQNVMQITTGITGQAETQYTLNPNPFSDVVVVSSFSLAGEAKISVYTADGRIIYSANSENSQTQIIDSSQWPIGVYIFVFENKQGMFKAIGYKTL